jgi:hypothetical protein
VKATPSKTMQGEAKPTKAVTGGRSTGDKKQGCFALMKEEVAVADCIRRCGHKHCKTYGQQTNGLDAQTPSKSCILSTHMTIPRLDLSRQYKQDLGNPYKATEICDTEQVVIQTH